MKKLVLEEGLTVEIKKEDEQELREELKRGDEFIDLGEAIINRNKIIGMFLC